MGEHCDPCHCRNGEHDWDEEGTDCGGHCSKSCDGDDRGDHYECRVRDIDRMEEYKTVQLNVCHANFTNDTRVTHNGLMVSWYNSTDCEESSMNDRREYVNGACLPGFDGEYQMLEGQALDCGIVNSVIVFKYEVSVQDTAAFSANQTAQNLAIAAIKKAILASLPELEEGKLRITILVNGVPLTTLSLAATARRLLAAGTITFRAEIIEQGLNSVNLAKLTAMA